MDKNNSSKCFQQLPSVYEYAGEMTETDFILTIVCSVVSLVTVLIYIWDLSRIVIKIKNQLTKTPIIVLLGINPFFSVLSLVVLLMPHTEDVINRCKIVYVGIALNQFLSLIQAYFFGERGMLLLLHNEDIRLNVQPFCCCKCLPMKKLTPKYYQNIKKCVLQAPILMLTMLFISTIMMADGLKEKFDDKMLKFYFRIIDVMSTILAIYSLFQIIFLTKNRLQVFALERKLLSVKVSMFLVNVLFNIIQTIFVQKEGECIMPSLEDNGMRVICYITIFIMLPLAVLSSKAYSHGLDKEEQFMSEFFKEIDAKLDGKDYDNAEVACIRSEVKLGRYPVMQYQVLGTIVTYFFLLVQFKDPLVGATNCDCYSYEKELSLVNEGSIYLAEM